MEEVYIIKLKGLPLKDLDVNSKRPSVYSNDLSSQVLFGFGIFHIVMGLIVTVFGLVTLLSDEWKLMSAGIGSGTIFISTGFIGIWSSFQRKDHFLKSDPAVKIFLFSSITSLITCICFIILVSIGFLDINGYMNQTTLERRHATTIVDDDGEVIRDDDVIESEPSLAANFTQAHPHLKTNVFIAMIVELVLSLLSSFTACRILWPDCLKTLGADNWPTRPEIKRKIIVKTSIYASKGMYQASDFSRALGPNCVVSLNSPNSNNYCQQSSQVSNYDSGAFDQQVEDLDSPGSVSLASYDDTEFGHDEQPKVDGNSSHLVPPNEQPSSHITTSTSSSSSPILNSDEKKEISVMGEQEGMVTRRKKKKKMIPAPKLPPPPPPPPNSSPPNSNMSLSSHSSCPGHCVQNEMKANCKSHASNSSSSNNNSCNESEEGNEVERSQEKEEEEKKAGRENDERKEKLLDSRNSSLIKQQGKNNLSQKDEEEENHVQLITASTLHHHHHHPHNVTYGSIHHGM